MQATLKWTFGSGDVTAFAALTINGTMFVGSAIG
jgi:hypothetical protein